MQKEKDTRVINQTHIEILKNIIGGIMFHNNFTSHHIITYQDVSIYEQASKMYAQ